MYRNKGVIRTIMVTFFDSKHRPIAHMFRKKKYVELSYPGYTLHGDIFLKHNEIN